MATIMPPMASPPPRFASTIRSPASSPGFYEPWQPHRPRPPPTLSLLNHRWPTASASTSRGSTTPRSRRCSAPGNMLPEGAEPLARPTPGISSAGFAPARRSARAAARRGHRPARSTARRRVQRLGPHAVRARGFWQGRRRAHAAPGAARRGDARARHSRRARARRSRRPASQLRRARALPGAVLTTSRRASSTSAPLCSIRRAASEGACAAPGRGCTNGTRYGSSTGWAPPRRLPRPAAARRRRAPGRAPPRSRSGSACRCVRVMNPPDVGDLLLLLGER